MAFDKSTPIRSKEGSIDITDGSYTFEIDLHEGHYDAHKYVSLDLNFTPTAPSPVSKKAKTGEDGKSDDDTRKVVKAGRYRGNILDRPSPIFFEMADAESGELQGLACLFCEPDGTASRISHPSLQDRAVRGGGFLQIEQVSIEEPHRRRGNDLGLRLIHEVLVFLKDMWTLAVMEVGHVEIQRHFGRMGFLQAGRKAGDRDAMFLTKELYFETSGEANDSTAIEKWIPKDRAGEVEIHESVTHQLRAPDEELKTHVTGMLCEGASANGELIEECIRNGASIDNSGVLHITAANTTGTDLSVLKMLVRMGGNVNVTDDNGMTPLHVAAGAQRAAVVRYLLESGANVFAKDLGGETPLQTFTASLRNASDFYSAFGMSASLREGDIIPKLETATALMTREQKSSLIEGWMPPRMHECLLTTCELEEPEHDASTGLFTRNQPTPLADVIADSMNFSRIEYIPLSVLKSDPRGIFKSFHDAWKMILCAIWAVLKRREVPTVRKIDRELCNGLYDLRKIEHYKSKGGKIEFALDAVLKVTENVVKDGDDGWEYFMFKEEIEANDPTPLDEMYDVARFMCINRGGGSLFQPGPHRNVTMYGMEDSDALDDDCDY